MYLFGLDALDDGWTTDSKQADRLRFLSARCLGVCQFLFGHTVLCSPGSHFRHHHIFHARSVGCVPEYFVRRLISP